MYSDINNSLAELFSRTSFLIKRAQIMPLQEEEEKQVDFMKKSIESPLYATVYKTFIFASMDYFWSF